MTNPLVVMDPGAWPGGNRIGDPDTVLVWQHIDRPQPSPRTQDRNRHDDSAAVRSRRRSISWPDAPTRPWTLPTVMRLL